MSRPPRPAPPSVQVRRATARDAKRLTRIVRSSRAYEGRYASAVARYTVGADYVETHEVFAAVEEHDPLHVLGFYALVLDPPDLDLMFVADAAQGRGVGRLLAAHMTERARAAGLDAVPVVSHPPAEGFYRSVGAVPAGTVPAHPPGVTWDRPRLEFRVGRRSTAG